MKSNEMKASKQVPRKGRGCVVCVCVIIYMYVCDRLPPIIQNPVAPHCQGGMRKLVPTGSEQILNFEFLSSGAQLPFIVKSNNKFFFF